MNELKKHGAEGKFPKNPLEAVSVEDAVDLALDNVSSQFNKPQLNQFAEELRVRFNHAMNEM